MRLPHADNEKRDHSSKNNSKGATMQLTNCRQVTQIIHDEDDDEKDEKSAKWRRWVTHPDHFRAVSVAWIILFFSFTFFPPYFFVTFLLRIFLTAAVKRACHIVTESVKHPRSTSLFCQKFKIFSMHPKKLNHLLYNDNENMSYSINF